MKLFIFIFEIYTARTYLDERKGCNGRWKDKNI